MKKAARESLSARLFVPGWWLNGVLRKTVYENFKPRMITIARKGGKAVGIAMIFQDGTIWLFVRKKERRRGIGTELFVRSMRKLGRKKIFKVYDSNDEVSRKLLLAVRLKS